MGGSRVAESELITAHGIGRKPRREKASWTTPFKMGRCSKERREFVEGWLRLENKSS